MPGKQANNNPGLCPVKGHLSSPYSWIRARDQLSSLSLCTAGATPQCQMLVLQPAFHLSSYILPRNPQERLRPNEPLTKTIPCEPVGNFIPSHSGMPGTQNSPTARRIEMSFNAFWH